MLLDVSMALMVVDLGCEGKVVKFVSMLVKYSKVHSRFLKDNSSSVRGIIIIATVVEILQGIRPTVPVHCSTG